jgi:uncharacterized repeat protein (TIGR01451 family)
MGKGNAERLRGILAAGALVVAGLASVAMDAPRVAAHDVDPPYLDGANSECDVWKVKFLELGFTDASFEIAEEGWAWVDAARKLQNASGVVTKSKVAHNDTPANHYSHDWNVDILVDEGQEFLLSDKNGRLEGSDVPQKIELEWETGIRPDQRHGDGTSAWFPRWVRPNVGDRVWTNGHWVFDCGHGEGVSTPYPVPDDPDSCPEGTIGAFGNCSDAHYRTEIHPGRAIASMRSQTDTVPTSGSTPVPVTATDLYIRGNGAFMVQQLACGIGIILEPRTCETEQTRIDDLYSFDVCLPPKPVDHAYLDWKVSDGPGNTLSTIPDIEDVVATGACTLPVDQFGNRFDNGTMLHVTVDLRGTGASPDDVFARRIVAGWAFPTNQPARHLEVVMDQLDLHADHEPEGFDGEMSFFWMNVDRSPVDEWQRLVDFEIPTDTESGELCKDHTNRLNDIDDDNNCGNGLLNFDGPRFNFYLHPGQPFTVRTTGYEQDCYDTNFGDGHFTISEYVGCHGADPEQIFNYGNNDKLADILAIFPWNVEPGRYEPSATTSVFGDAEFEEYQLEFLVNDIALTDEDHADLSVAKDCAPAGEVALVGQPFTCTVTVTNLGPGLPRNVSFTDTVSTELPAGSFTVGTPTATIGPDAAAVPCAFTATAAFRCDILSIPVGHTATITVDITPHVAGSYRNRAVATTVSTEPLTFNNVGEDTIEAYLPLTVDVQPGKALGTVYTAKQGLTSVAVLTTSTFKAANLDPATVCFGDAELPVERACQEAHGTGHLTDIDKDGDLDLLLHYDTRSTGIDRGDAKACLIGRTTSGDGVFGCDDVRVL